jgi:hypothetical protein
MSFWQLIFIVLIQNVCWHEFNGIVRQGAHLNLVEMNGELGSRVEKLPEIPHIDMFLYSGSNTN